MKPEVTLRQKVENELSSGAWEPGRLALAEMWRSQPNAASAAYVLSRFQAIRDHLPMRSCRIALLRSFTVEPLVPLLRAEALINGVDAAVQIGDFNAYAQEILDETSSLYRFSPEIVILAVQTRDLSPELWIRYPDLSAAEVQACVDRVVGNFDQWVRTFRSRSEAHLIIDSFELPDRPAQGFSDYCSELGQIAAIQRVNHGLARIAAVHKGVYLLDYDSLIARHGRARWHDEEKWLTVRMPIAADQQIHLVNEWLRFVYPLVGKTCKVLVTDLDNTLWGGVIGEDGMEGIQLGLEYPGAAFQAVQRTMLNFYRRGILLAICSKNNLSDAMQALEQHPGMLLKPEHFAAFRINWMDKAHNLREIATELNVGIDALAFLDDNPAERERVRTELPEVNVIELPEEPMRYADVLRENPAFERLSLTDEDRERGRYYSEQHRRVELEKSAGSLEDFYRSLGQELEIATVTAATLSRVAQLTQRTNQFNLTTRRYSEQQITDMATRSDWKLYVARVSDRFGDNGIVGVAMTHDSEDICEIDTFLMSCRVVGRTVETALLSFLLEQARARKMKEIHGWFIPTKKNVELVKDFYPRHGFRKVTEQDENILWSWDVEKATLSCPEWIQFRFVDGAIPL